MSSATMGVYLALLSKQVSLMLQGAHKSNPTIIQSVIHLQDVIEEGYVVSLRREDASTKLALFTAEEVDAAVARMADTKGLHPLVAASVRLDIDLSTSKDTPYEDDFEILEARMMESYNCWDFLRLFFVTFLR
jgi:hypothetical protein